MGRLEGDGMEGGKFSSSRNSNRQSKAYHFRRVNWLKMGMTRDDAAMFYNNLSISHISPGNFRKGFVHFYVQYTNQTVYNLSHNPNHFRSS